MSDSKPATSALIVVAFGSAALGACVGGLFMLKAQTEDPDSAAEDDTIYAQHFVLVDDEGAVRAEWGFSGETVVFSLHESALSSPRLAGPTAGAQEVMLRGVQSMDVGGVSLTSMPEGSGLDVSTGASMPLVLRTEAGDPYLMMKGRVVAR